MKIKDGENKLHDDMTFISKWFITHANLLYFSPGYVNIKISDTINPDYTYKNEVRIVWIKWSPRCQLTRRVKDYFTNILRIHDVNFMVSARGIKQSIKFIL
jgi:hypothetical protein